MEQLKRVKDRLSRRPKQTRKLSPSDKIKDASRADTIAATSQISDSGYETTPITDINPGRPPSPSQETCSIYPATVQHASDASPPPEQTQSYVESQNLWPRAYELVRNREKDLIADYEKHMGVRHNEPVDSVVEGLVNDREKKQWRLPLQNKNIKVREQAEKLAKFLLWTDKIVAQALSTQPYAALAWSGVSMLLPLLETGSAQHEAMLDGFTSISHLQLYWNICEASLVNLRGRHAQDVLRQVAELYSHILEYQARVICHLSRSQLSRAWQKIQDDWTGQVERVEQLSESCKQLIALEDREKVRTEWRQQLEEMYKSRELLAEIRQALEESYVQAQNIYEDQKERQLLHDLASGYEDDKDSNPVRAKGTCEWFFENERFREWRDTSGSALLWVSADPGCGKSVLARSLIDEGRLSTTVSTSTVCYFFFKDGDERRMHSADAMSAILHQLFTRDKTRELIRNALDAHQSFGRSLAGIFSQLWKILVICARSSSAGEIVCVLDALDECTKTGAAEILGKIQEFFRPGQMPQGSSKLKILVTSRPYSNISEGFQRLPPTAAFIRFNGDDNSDEIGADINRVIDEKVQSLQLSESVRERIARRLKDMENRTYLWLHLTFSIIEASPAEYGREPDLESLLSDLPPQTSTAYEKILARSTGDGRTSSKTETLLQIVLAAKRPLTIDEAHYALVLALDGPKPTTLVELKQELWDNDFKDVVKQLCGLFIQVYNSKLSFIHQTAKEFLVAAPEPGLKWKGRFTIPGSQDTITRSCLRYLQLSDINNSDRPIFMNYAAIEWAGHYNSQVEEAQNSSTEDARNLCRISHKQAREWARVHFPFWSFHDWTDLILASRFGLVPVVEAILAEGVDINASSRALRTPLYTATQNGHINTVRTLLTAGAELQTEVVIAAAKNTWIGRELMMLLLEKRPDQVIITAAVVKAAAKNPGSGRNVMELLLKMRPDEVDITPSVIEAAAGNRQSGRDVMALLLETRPEQVDITPSVVEAAAENQGSGRDVMELLLEMRPDQVDVTPGVLKAAARNSEMRRDIIALLLDKRPDQVTITADVVKATAVNGRSDGDAVMELLLEKCRDRVDFTGDLVKAAAGNARMGIGLMGLLLEKYPEQVDITAEVVKTAAISGSKDVMALLLEVRPNQVVVTAEVTQAAARNLSNGAEMMALLLDKRPDQVVITPDIIKLAAENWENGKEVILLLLEKRPDQVTITVDVIKALARTNRLGLDRGTEMLTLLLNEDQNKVSISVEVAEIISKSREDRKDIVASLLNTWPN